MSGKSSMNNKRKKGTIFMLVGLLLLAASFSLALYNIWDAHRADVAAQAAAGKLKNQIDKNLEEKRAAIYENNPETEESMTEASEAVSDKGADGFPQMPTTEIDGNAYIGLLEIPSQSLSLPVMADWDYEKLKTAPCRFSGSYYQNNLVIAGHNYARHFSPIKWLEAGSDVYFTTVTGNVYHYTVDSIETLQPQSVEDMKSGDWDLTLFTCTTGGGSRCAVRCFSSTRQPENE